MAKRNAAKEKLNTQLKEAKKKREKKASKKAANGLYACGLEVRLPYTGDSIHFHDDEPANELRSKVLDLVGIIDVRA